FRRARINALTADAAARQLETLAAETEGTIAYLAAMSRAEVASAKRDRNAAVNWYSRARDRHPRSTAATVALSVLGPGSPLPLADSDAEDPYYTYPCRILTPAVDAELAARIRQEAGQ